MPHSDFSAQGFNIPKVILGYDTDETEKQVNRSVGFCKLLGFHVIKEKVDSNGHQPNARHSSFLQHIKKKYPNSILINQKCCTALLQRAFLNDPESRSQLEEQFECLLKQVRGDLLQDINKWIKDQLTAITKLANGRKILLLNYRHSSNANADQQMDIPTFMKLVPKGICVWTLCADSRKSNWTKIPNSTALFNTALKQPYSILKGNTEEAEDNAGWFKFRHALLLVELRKRLGPQILGIAGNTSGTLDIAAFLGWNVCSIHKFREKDKLKAEEIRILIQIEFMKVINSIESDIGKVQFWEWIDNECQNDKLFPVLKKSILPKADTDHEVLPISGSLTWIKNVDSVELNNLVTKPKWLQHTWWQSLKKELQDIVDQ